MAVWSNALIGGYGSAYRLARYEFGPDAGETLLEWTPLVVGETAADVNAREDGPGWDRYWGPVDWRSIDEFLVVECHWAAAILMGRDPRGEDIWSQARSRP